MVIGIDHGYYAIKTKQVCFPTGIIRYEYEPYTMHANSARTVRLF